MYHTHTLALACLRSVQQVAAQVTTAEGLSREEADAIQRGLAPLLKPGQKLTLTEQVGAWGEPAKVQGAWAAQEPCGQH